jgi:hypothetical protein
MGRQKGVGQFSISEISARKNAKSCWLAVQQNAAALAVRQNAQQNVADRSTFGLAGKSN